jgi:8-amino-7-oxononanoate synthase
VLDFTSALYLGFEHAWRDLPKWSRLTLGKPAALEEPPSAADVQTGLAELIGCERAVLAPSTLHAFWDLFEMLTRRGMSALVDESSYAIAKWGLERAAARGMAVRWFDADDWQSLQYLARETRRPVVVTDGYVPGEARAAPLARYIDLVKARGGLVVVDDTQALGIFGRSPGREAPYGRGGGGSLRRAGIEDGSVVVVSSLAKAFGAPVAVLAGSEDLVASFERESATRVHCSPPSEAVIAAASRAVAMNRTCGDAIRLRLARLVTLLRQGLRRLNLLGTTGLFPVQTLLAPGKGAAEELHGQLLSRGLRAVLHSGRTGGQARISFLITARHTPRDIRQALALLADALRSPSLCEWGGRRYGYGIEFRSRIV